MKSEEEVKRERKGGSIRAASAGTGPYASNHFSTNKVSPSAIWGEAQDQDSIFRRWRAD